LLGQSLLPCRSLEHERTRAESELRAYVFLQRTELERRRSKIFSDKTFEWSEGRDATTGRISFGYRNSGKTPAKNVRVAAKAIMIDRDETFDFLDIGELRPIGPIGPNDSLDGDIQIMVNNDGTIEKVLHGRDLEVHVRDGKEIHLFGRIEYDDEFATGRWTTFHRYVGGDVGWDPEWVLHAAKDGSDYT
jgi:hypothetical protein